ncbi:MAG: hypothetical protein MJ041_02470, partial [Acidaminococcaceae bacterium]|nr:hypothetical protein [Acidaminococcaceae bacterium]
TWLAIVPVFGTCHHHYSLFATLYTLERSDMWSDVFLFSAAVEIEPQQDADSAEYRLTLNRVSLEAMKTRLFQDIMVDMSVCEIEGWNKLEYLRELRDMLDGILKGK